MKPLHYPRMFKSYVNKRINIDISSISTERLLMCINISIQLSRLSVFYPNKNLTNRTDC